MRSKGGAAKADNDGVKGEQAKGSSVAALIEDRRRCARAVIECEWAAAMERLRLLIDFWVRARAVAVAASSQTSSMSAKME